MNVNMLMQQAQRMQKEVENNMKKAKEQLALKEVQGEAGSGLVKVIMTGRYVVKRIHIDPELLKDDADMIEDLIAAAINDAVRQAEVVHEETMKGANSGMGLPPGLSGLF
jgi:DNA-binding YbaB/EbfC family protein